MKINRDNYEHWFLDYLEGRLDRQGQAEVQHFLELHPDLAGELDAFAPTVPTPANLVYPGKVLLKKAHYHDPEVFDTTAVAFLEGDLSAEETLQFERWLEQNPAQSASFARLSNCRLQPDLSLRYPGKKRLKRKSPATILLLRVVPVAAALLLAFFLFYPAARQERPVSLQSDLQARPKDNPVKAEPIAKPTTSRPEVTKPASKPTPSKTVRPEPEPPVAPTRAPRLLASAEILSPRQPLIRSEKVAAHELVNPAAVSASPLLAAAGEIPIADYLQQELQTLKAAEPGEIITRKELVIAGLHLFSRLPGHRLTGKKGADGRLRAISFNTQLLAFSIPVNREE